MHFPVGESSTDNNQSIFFYLPIFIFTLAGYYVGKTELSDCELKTGLMSTAIIMLRIYNR